MSSSIDVDSLLAALTADAPCGEDLEYDAQFVEMEKYAQGSAERQFGNTVIPAEPPDWREVKKAALDLSKRTRDLRVTVYLARALLNTEGLAGFADGVALLEGLLEQHWVDVYPQLDPDDDNDPTLRINTIVTLCDQETTLTELRNAALVQSRALGRFSLRDVQIAAGLITPTLADGEEQAAAPTQSMINGAFQDVALEELQETAQTVVTTLNRAERIEALLTDQVGVTQAPNMSGLTALLKEMRHTLQEQLQRRGAGMAGEEDAALETEGDGPIAHSGAVAAPTQRMMVGEITSREDVVRTLDKICDYYRRYEPSSPVPFMLQRTKKLVSMDFMEILHHLTPSGTEQADLIFGIEPAAEE